ncbi:MAG: SET domain-containing protein-lysine N-methyltransferase [Anaerolineae bacterium]|nr:SET domain-containing protein-lysine N-methyltransferase [Anaerolineae bacterium]
MAVVFGFGGLYNHSSDANIYFHRDYRNKQMVFTATADIAAGEACFVNYYQGSDEEVDPANLDFNAYEKA